MCNEHINKHFCIQKSAKLLYLPFESIPFEAAETNKYVN